MGSRRAAEGDGNQSVCRWTVRGADDPRMGRWLIEEVPGPAEASISPEEASGEIEEY